MPMKSPLNADVINATVGVQSAAVRVTATAAGYTTGVIPAGASFVSVSAGGSANNIVRLPYPVLGNVIKLKEDGTTGFEVRPQAATQYINGTLCDSNKELACANGTGVAVFTCTVGGTAGKWVQYWIDDDGTIDAGGTPD